MPFSPTSPLSKGPLCHLICIFLYHLAILAVKRQFCYFCQIRHFRQNRHFSKGPLCHLICIFVYSLVILAINRQFCHFRQIRHFCQNRYFPKGPFAISFEFLFTVWRFWQLGAISAIFANACISGHISARVLQMCGTFG